MFGRARYVTRCRAGIGDALGSIVLRYNCSRQLFRPTCLLFLCTTSICFWLMLRVLIISVLLYMVPKNVSLGAASNRTIFRVSRCSTPETRQTDRQTDSSSSSVCCVYESAFPRVHTAVASRLAPPTKQSLVLRYFYCSTQPTRSCPASHPLAFVSCGQANHGCLVPLSSNPLITVFFASKSAGFYRYRRQRIGIPFWRWLK